MLFGCKPPGNTTALYPDCSFSHHRTLHGLVGYSWKYFRKATKHLRSLIRGFMSARNLEYRSPKGIASFISLRQENKGGFRGGHLGYGKQHAMSRAELSNPNIALALILISWWYLSSTWGKLSTQKMERQSDVKAGPATFSIGANSLLHALNLLRKSCAGWANCKCHSSPESLLAGLP